MASASATGSKKNVSSVSHSFSHLSSLMDSLFSNESPSETHYDKFYTHLASFTDTPRFTEFLTRHTFNLLTRMMTDLQRPPYMPTLYASIGSLFNLTVQNHTDPRVHSLVKRILNELIGQVVSVKSTCDGMCHALQIIATMHVSSQSLSDSLASQIISVLIRILKQSPTSSDPIEMKKSNSNENGSSKNYFNSNRRFLQIHLKLIRKCAIDAMVGLIDHGFAKKLLACKDEWIIGICSYSNWDDYPNLQKSSLILLGRVTPFIQNEIDQNGRSSPSDLKMNGLIQHVLKIWKRGDLEKIKKKLSAPPLISDDFYENISDSSKSRKSRKKTISKSKKKSKKATPEFIGISSELKMNLLNFLDICLVSTALFMSDKGVGNHSREDCMKIIQFLLKVVGSSISERACPSNSMRMEIARHWQIFIWYFTSNLPGLTGRWKFKKVWRLMMQPIQHIFKIISRDEESEKKVNEDGLKLAGQAWETWLYLVKRAINANLMWTLVQNKSKFRNPNKVTVFEMTVLPMLKIDDNESVYKGCVEIFDGTEIKLGVFEIMVNEIERKSEAYRETMVLFTCALIKSFFRSISGKLIVTTDDFKGYFEKLNEIVLKFKCIDILACFVDGFPDFHGMSEISESIDFKKLMKMGHEIIREKNGKNEWRLCKSVDRGCLKWIHGRSEVIELNGDWIRWILDDLKEGGGVDKTDHGNEKLLVAKNLFDHVSRMNSTDLPTNWMNMYGEVMNERNEKRDNQKMEIDIPEEIRQLSSTDSEFEEKGVGKEIQIDQKRRKATDSNESRLTETAKIDIDTHGNMGMGMDVDSENEKDQFDQSSKRRTFKGTLNTAQSTNREKSASLFSKSNNPSTNSSSRSTSLKVNSNSNSNLNHNSDRIIVKSSSDLSATVPVSSQKSKNGLKTKEKKTNPSKSETPVSVNEKGSVDRPLVRKKRKNGERQIIKGD